MSRLLVTSPLGGHLDEQPGVSQVTLCTALHKAIQKGSCLSTFRAPHSSLTLFTGPWTTPAAPGWTPQQHSRIWRRHCRLQRSLHWIWRHTPSGMALRPWCLVEGRRVHPDTAHSDFPLKIPSGPVEATSIYSIRMLSYCHHPCYLKHNMVPMAPLHGTDVPPAWYRWSPCT